MRSVEIMMVLLDSLIMVCQIQMKRSLEVISKSVQGGLLKDSKLFIRGSIWVLETDFPVCFYYVVIT
jgi:hypothetical protein